MPTRRCTSLWPLLLLCGCGATPNGTAAPDQVTVPLVIEGNRPFVDLTFERADGSTRTGRFLVDSGGGGFLLAESLATDIGLASSGRMREDGTEFAMATAPPKARVGAFPLTLDAKRVIVVLGARSVVPPSVSDHADGLFPGHVLARYHVVFDYPHGTFTLARPGALAPQGDASPMPVSKASGFPRTEVEIDGVKRGFLIDTGASFTMVTETLLSSLGAAHPDWERHPGAFGEARTLGGQALETLFVAAGRWGARPLSRFGVVSQREGTFERRMSSMMPAPIVGSLAGNVLRGFRVDLDYPNETLYLSTP